MGDRMKAAEYHADPAPVPSLSSSIAKLLLYRSPLHAWMAHPKLNPDYRPEESSRFDLGSAAHALLVEGADNMAVIEADDWRTKVAKEARDAARLEGKFPVLAHQYAAVKAMVETCRDAIISNTDLAGYTLDKGVPEHSIVWHEGETYMRARLDWVSADRNVIYDYKTTENAEPEAFLRTMFSLNYDLQGAFYLRANQRPDTKYILIAQEIGPPYAVSFIGLPPAFIDLGTRKVERAIVIWQRCMKTGVWPSYPSRVFYPELPAWVTAREEERELQEVENGIFL